MTIGFFLDEYLPRLHGDITATLALRYALEVRGHTVYIVTPKMPGYADHDARVVRVPSFDPKVLRYKTRAVLLYPGLARKLAKYKFDVVHSQTQFGMGLLAHETAKVLGAPHVSTMHSVFAETATYNKIDAYPILALISIVYPLYFRSVPQYTWLRPKGDVDWRRLKEQAWWAGTVFLNSTDAVIAPSAHLARSLVAHGLTRQYFVLPNGLDVQAFRKAAKTDLPKDIPAKGYDTWFTYVGRITDEKRVSVFVEAMRSVRSPRVKALIVGSGPADAEIRRLVARHDLQGKVYLLGRREPYEVPAILAHSDVFVLPSYRFDNQPMVILEALAAGLPIMYCDDHLTEGLTKNNAYLTATPKADSLAKAIDELAADKAARRTMGTASLALALQFDTAALAQKVETIYQTAISQKHARVY